MVVAILCGGLGAFLALRSTGPQQNSRSAALERLRARFASSAPSRVVVNAWGQSPDSGKIHGRPLAARLAVFRSTRLAAALPSPSGQMQPLASVAAHVRGDPGRLLPNQTRRVATAGGPIYLVPTVRGWVCMQGVHFETCQWGLQAHGIAWDFQSVADGVDVVGIAADDVSGVALDYGKARRGASLEGNVFFVHRRISFSPAAQTYRVGTLAISYLNGASAAVPVGGSIGR